MSDFAESARPAAGSAPRVSEFWRRAIEEFHGEMDRRGWAEATKEAYERAVGRFAAWAADRAPHQVTAEAVAEYRRELATRAYSFDTVHLYLRAVRRFYELRIAAGSALVDPTEGLVIGGKPKRVPQVLAEEEVRRLIEATTNLRDRAIVEVLYAAGLRHSELLALELEDVKGDEIHVRAGKGGKGRVVPLTGPARAALETYVREMRGEEPGALWRGVRGKPLHKSMVSVLLRGAARRAQIDRPVTVHTLRRTVATHLLRRGASPVVVAELLGHGSGRTLHHYVRAAAADIKETHQRTHPRET